MRNFAKWTEISSLFDKYSATAVTFQQYADLTVVSMTLVSFYLESLNYIITLMESAYKWMPTGGWLQIALGWGKYPENTMTWWRHQMVTFSALLAICAGNSPVNGEFPAQRPVTRSFDLRLNKRLSKQSWGWWFETLSCPLWRHCNGRRAPTFLKAYSEQGRLLQTCHM